MLFDRICRENGIKHLLTAPRSPTTTGKVERFHRTLHREFLDGKVFNSVTDAQAQLDRWVEFYNHERPHQGIGMVVPFERFRLAKPEPASIELEAAAPDTTVHLPLARRRVNPSGQISFAAVRYRAGKWLAGETVEVICDAGLVHIEHRGVLVATYPRRHKPSDETTAQRRGQKRAPLRPVTPRPTASAASVTRKVDSSGNVSFAGTNYRAGNKYRRRQVQAAVIDGNVEISIGEQLIRRHPIPHDRTREHGALANPGGRPNRINAKS